MMKESKVYAAYGTNMCLQQMARKCPSSRVIGVGVLEGYKLTFRGIRKGVATIERCEGASLPVVLWTISEKCEKALDSYEGFPKLYTKENVNVKLKNDTIEAMVYVMVDEYCKIPVKPSPFYIETIQRGYENHGIIMDGLFNAVQDVYRELAINKHSQKGKYNNYKYS
ncbi:MAG: gamma-glutamylcyclotransferase family protein [Aminipila sp.]